VRTDPSKPKKFFEMKQWSEAEELSMATFVAKDENNPGKESVARSFSGHERNRLFMQGDGNFDDVSLVSGVDFPQDSRSFVLLDFDRDGWLDMGVTSPLRPRFQIFRNAMGDRLNQQGASTFIRLEGGNSTSKSSIEWSARDGYGASLLVTTGETKRAFQYSCNEGLASQNSKWLHVGLGEAKKIDRVEINWLSGKTSFHENLESGKRYVLQESGKTIAEKSITK
jgi:hypothetical protein